jgi:hypothetical protein
MLVFILFCTMLEEERYLIKRTSARVKVVGGKNVGKKKKKPPRYIHTYIHAWLLFVKG